jgi:hypothetical protein
MSLFLYKWFGVVTIWVHFTQEGGPIHWCLNLSVQGKFKVFGMINNTNSHEDLDYLHISLWYAIIKYTKLALLHHD